MLAVWQLVSVGLVGTAPFVSADMPLWLVTVAAAEIFSLPFLFMLEVSPLARVCSAALAVATPFALMAGVLYQAYYANPEPNLFGTVAGGLVLMVLGLASFMILDGPKAIMSPAAKHAKK